MPVPTQGKRGTQPAEGRAGDGGLAEASPPPAGLGATSFFTSSATIGVRLDALLTASPALAAYASLRPRASQAERSMDSGHMWAACRLVHIVFEAQPFAVHAFDAKSGHNAFSPRIRPETPGQSHRSRGAQAGPSSEASALPRRHAVAPAEAPAVSRLTAELSLYKPAVYFVSVSQDRHDDAADIFPILPGDVRLSSACPSGLAPEPTGAANQGPQHGHGAQGPDGRLSPRFDERAVCVKGVFEVRAPRAPGAHERTQGEVQPPALDLSILDHLQAPTFCKAFAKQHPQPVILQVAFERRNALEFQGTFIGAESSVVRAGTFLASTIHSLLPSVPQTPPSAAQPGLQARRERRLRLLAERRRAYRQGQVAEFFIEDILTGVTIGRQGERLGRLAKQYQVEIRVLPNEQGFRRVCIYGKSEAAVAQVQAELESVYRLVYVRPEGLASWTGGPSGQRAVFLQNLAQRCGLHALWIDAKLAALILYGSRAAGEAFQKMLRISGHTTPGAAASAEPAKISPSASCTQTRGRWQASL